VINLFFVLVEVFTPLYSNVPHEIHPLEYLFLGLGSKRLLVPWMWSCELLTLGCVALLLFPGIRRREGLLACLCIGVIAAIWIEKGLGLVVAGFVPSPLGKVTQYRPTAPEILITLGIYALGFLILSVLYKIVVSVRESVQTTTCELKPM
jgi:Ni/Fe-hydrogenase subunit HybB-like protein